MFWFTRVFLHVWRFSRFDCPKEWPDLIDILFNNMKNTNNLIKHRAVLYLYHVVKSLSTKRLIGDRKLFHDLSSAIYSSVLNYWNSSMIEFGNMVCIRWIYFSILDSMHIGIHVSTYYIGYFMLWFLDISDKWHYYRLLRFSRFQTLIRLRSLFA